MTKFWVMWMALLASGALNDAGWAQNAGNSGSVAPPPAASALPRVPLKPEKTDVGGGSLPPGEDPQNHLLLPLVKHIAQDQRTFWTFPLRLRTQDLPWLLPSAAFTGSVIASDSWIAKQVPQSATRIKQSKDFSDYAVFSLVGVTGGSYLLGQMTHNDHMQEAGLLGGEAAFDATGVAYILKEITQRPRPYLGNGHGTFFQGGSSFPSEHAAVAWAAASVWAHEYPGTLSQILAYGLASTVTVTRITGKQHFASDALIGSALGWYFGREVYRAHHNPELGGTSWGSLWSAKSPEKPRNPTNMGSPYVALDSWVYPAIERLSALGYIQTAFLGIRPWTRMECARLLEEANEKVPNEDAVNQPAAKILETLNAEFGPEASRLSGSENLGVELESIYTRATTISGRPLNDGFHFGETITNDYGRPYGEGLNNITGATAQGEAGPFAFYVRGEYQHAPAVPSDAPQVLQAIANIDLTTPVPDGKAGIGQFDLLEASVSVNVRNIRISFGKESQWLGIGESGSLLMSDNAEPALMVKLENAVPFRVPLLSKLFGPVRAEYFIGRLAGQEFEANGGQLLGPGQISPQPFLDGGKISFRPTSNFEFGMGFTAMFVGPGLPFTWSDFLRTFYVHNQTGSTTAGNNPAKRASEADFSYRVPGLRDWLTVYADTLVVDEISPIGSSRATVNPGIYMPKFPKLNRLELRAEGIHEPLTSEFAPGFVYYGLRRFRSGYTNDGNLMGSWIGRAGRGGQGWLTYWFSPRSSAQFGYRLQEVSSDFLEGGRSADYTVKGDVRLSRDVSLAGFVQYEQWRFPVLSAGDQSNVTVSVQLTLHPQRFVMHH
jgi:hypothetical protein